MLTRSAKIWLVFAILLCSATTVLNLMEGRIPSVVLAVIEIAALVGRPPATVNSQLWRAKLLLRQQIQERRLLE